MEIRRIARTVFVGYAALVAAYACNKPVQPDIEDFLSDVRIVDCENALRIPFELTFSQPCSYRIEYWQKSNPEIKGNTRTFESTDGHGNATVMFLYPETEYEYQIEVMAGSEVSKTDVREFITGRLPSGVPVYTISDKYPATVIPGYTMQFQATEPGYVTFTDTDGNVVWYEQTEMAVRQAYYDPATNTLSMNLGFKLGQNGKFQRIGKKIVVMDLEGNRIIDVLSSPESIDLPHHEIKMMPDGHLLMLYNVVRNFDLTSHGGTAEQEVYGEGFSVLDKNFKSLWSWDCFDELDPVADDYLYDNGSFNDLVHANSVSYDEKEGNWYMTFNHLSELWKIDGQTGKVLYRVGPNGDMKMSEDDYADGLHAAVVLAPDRILCFDNGRDTGVSRALIYEMDPLAKTAKASLSVEIPAEFASRDRSNVSLIRNGEMLFFGSTQGRANIFTDLSGNILKVVTRTQISYRSYYYENIEY